jgi:5S rRNA maturation endonuclease (ribonuclease M5)
MASQRWEDLKAEVLERTIVEEFARDNLQGVQPGGAGELKALCLFHDEKKPSMHVNLDRRVFYCQGCGEKGNVIDLFMAVRNLTYKDALLQMAAELGIDTESPHPTRRPHKEKPPPPETQPIPRRKVEYWHNELRAHPEKVEHLVKRRGMKRKTLKKYMIGWDGQRYTLPVFDADGNVRNVRRYDPGKQSAKMIHYTEKLQGGETVKYGKPARLYGLDELRQATNGTRIHVCEGEWDRLMLAQQGLLAVTGTHGCKTWLAEWNKEFKGKEVVLLYDSDRQGKLATARVAKELCGVAATVRPVELPFDREGMKDITDWFVAAKRTLDELEAEIQATPPFTVEDETGMTVAELEEKLDFKMSGMTIYASIPPKFVLEIEPHNRKAGQMEINQATLGKPGRFKDAFDGYFLRTPKGLPRSLERWEDLVNHWKDNARVVPMPDEASELPALRELIEDELRQMPVCETRADLDRAKAVERTFKGEDGKQQTERFFKSKALRHLMIQDFGDISRPTFNCALRRIGCENKVVKVQAHPVKVWTIPEVLVKEADDDGK